MQDNRLEYYDPLYETITLEPHLPSRRIVRKAGLLDPREIVRAPEFARLAYLRQAGLGWLVFPSATHTRFAHSIGAWWLANVAESRIRVTIEGSVIGTILLRSWLEKEDLRQTFYLALLLHDLGHGPLSHMLEHNPEFVSGLSDAGLQDTEHEHRSVALMTGEGPLFERWKSVGRERYGEYPNKAHICNTLRKLENNKEICIPAASYSITEDKRFLKQCQHSHASHLGVVKEMVSGTLDLDRLDHAARDSYFSGTRQLVVNVSGLLSNLRVVSPYDGSANPMWFLNDGGATHAATLLFDRRLLFTTLFRNPHFLALTAMINKALSLLLLSIEDKSERASKCLDIALMDDDQFLNELCSSSEPGTSVLSKDVRAARPYFLAGKWNATDVGSDRTTISESLKDYEEKHKSNGVPNVVLYFERDFWGGGRSRQGREWLDAGSFFLEGTRAPLIQHPDYRDDFEHLIESSKIKYLWAFARTEETAAKAKVEITKIVGKGG